MSDKTESEAPGLVDTAVDRVRDIVDQAILRSVKGLEFVTSPAPEVGVTPKEILYERGTLRLYHYLPQTDEVYRVPVLLVMATTQKAFVFDLAPGQSMVEFLVKQGFDVYVVDWAPPTPEDRDRLELLTCGTTEGRSVRCGDVERGHAGCLRLRGARSAS